MTEAKSMLRQVHVLQSAYFYEHDRYAASLAQIGFEQVDLVLDNGTARYQIAIETADDGAYVATASSVVDFDKDGTLNVWQVTETGAVTQRVSD